MEVKNELLFSYDSFIINDYVDIFLSRMVNVMCCINVFDLFQRAMLNVLIAELTWRYTKMITIHIFGQNQSILDVQKPCMVNPSSYEALLEVMDQFKKTCSDKE